MYDEVGSERPNEKVEGSESFVESLSRRSVGSLDRGGPAKMCEVQASQIKMILIIWNVKRFFIYMMPNKGFPIFVCYATFAFYDFSFKKAKLSEPNLIIMLPINQASFSHVLTTPWSPGLTTNQSKGYKINSAIVSAFPEMLSSRCSTGT